MFDNMFSEKYAYLHGIHGDYLLSGREDLWNTFITTNVKGDLLFLLYLHAGDMYLKCLRQRTYMYLHTIIDHYKILIISVMFFSSYIIGGRRSPAVACWASDHWVASASLDGWVV